MSHQLLARFFVQSPSVRFADFSASVAVQTHSELDDQWSGDDTGNFHILCEPDNYLDPDSGNQIRRRYRIEVFRRDMDVWNETSQPRYALYKAGIYKRRLAVSFDGVEVLTRMLFITIQPDLHVYREMSGNRVDLVTSPGTQVSAHPLRINRTPSLVTAAPSVAARTVQVNESNDYKVPVIVKSNLPVDTFSNDLSVESDYNTWLRLAEKIRMTRKIVDSEFRWNAQWDEETNSSLIIRQNAQGKYVPLISDKDDARLLDPTHYSPWHRGSYYDPVELGLEKPHLLLPLSVESALSLYGHAVDRYTGTGETTAPTSAITLPLTVKLTTPHTLKITPAPLTLDDDNNFTSFFAVEANDEVSWTLAPEIANRLSLDKTSGTGRAAVVVRKHASYNIPSGTNFINVPLKGTSTAGGSTVSDTVNVHLEQYSPTKNALIPKQTASSSPFNHSLSDFGSAGQWTTWRGSVWEALATIENFPTLEFTLDKTHRIRSWSLQSVGTQNVKLATTLVLQGLTSDNFWKILDIAQLPSNFYSDTKLREDRTVHHREVVSKLRISVVATNDNYSTGSVSLPQIQVFAGEPVLPKMYGNQMEDVTVQSRYSGEGNGYQVFDREVSGYTIAAISPADWYLNFGNTVRNKVAENGTICRVLENDYYSTGYIALSFPRSRLIGYLYSIDDLSTAESQHANTPYAATLYFEGREKFDEHAAAQGSVAGGWSEIDVISLDKCIGYNSDSSRETAWFLVNQSTLNTYAQNVLGLSGNDRDKAFLVNEIDWHIIRFSTSANAWQDKGDQFTLETDAIDDADNQTHYADFKNIKAWEQLRLTVQSIMNVTRVSSGDNAKIAMPEMQLFGLPTEPINTKNNIATISYLKAEDTLGTVHNILGRHQRLSLVSTLWSNARFRLYVGEIANIHPDDQILYFDVYSANGDKAPHHIYLDGSEYYETWSSGNYETQVAYYEIYFNSVNDSEKIVVSSGYIGEQA